MPWCPVCRNEYVEGKTHCPDCDVDLVDELAEEEMLPEDIEIPEDYEFPEDFDPEEILSPATKPQPVKTYKRPEDRYEDMKSSAYTFLGVGGAGTIFMGMCWMKIINIPVHNFVLFIMTALFLIFIGIGIVSLKTSKTLKRNISVENDFIAEVINWYKTEISTSESDTAEADASLPEEMQYFKRSEAIRKMIVNKYPDIDETLLDKLVDDLYE